jgi:general secretion pathway protein I
VKRTLRGTQAFTLLEVMVAVAILAVSLAAIFSSEAGAVKMAARSRKMGLATLLVRCKMGEIEEDIANKGLPAVFANGTDNCCKEAPIEGYSCDFEIEPILLPETMFMTQQQDKQGKPGSGAAPAADPLSTLLGGNTPAGAAQSAVNGQMSPTGQPGASTNPIDAVKNMDPMQMLQNGGGVGGLAQMALGYVYPILKPSFEQQIRRATVTVRWKEGTISHQFDVTQYLVAEQPTMIDPLTGLPMAGQPGQPGQPGAPGVAPGQVGGALGSQLPVAAPMPVAP